MGIGGGQAELRRPEPELLDPFDIEAGGIAEEGVLGRTPE